MCCQQTRNFEQNEGIFKRTHTTVGRALEYAFAGRIFDVWSVELWVYPGVPPDARRFARRVSRPERSSRFHPQQFPGPYLQINYTVKQSAGRSRISKRCARCGGGCPAHIAQDI